MHYDEVVAQGLKVFDEVGIDRRWLDLGGETQSQNRLNRAYTDSLTIETRVLGSKVADTSAKIFGVDLPSPLMPAAMISSRVMEKLSNSSSWQRLNIEPGASYMDEFSKGVLDAGSVMWFGLNGESEPLAKFRKERGNAVAIVKPMKDKAKVLETLRWAESQGCIAVGMDVDAMFYEKAFDEDEGPEYLGPQTVEDLKDYRGAVSLPFVVKGVLSVHDAKVATKEVGADALVVSNHGGEVIDFSTPVLEALPAIRKSVGEGVAIFADGGMRRGSDAFKALALGADGVCFGSLLVLAFAAHGRRGVSEMLHILRSELRRIMSYAGCATVDDIGEDVVHHARV
jgi:4-hydroxymandelate oxidase